MLNILDVVARIVRLAGALLEKNVKAVKWKSSFGELEESDDIKA
jgi:hypothetical protein